MLTILTDLADYPPHFWMERQEQYFACGTATGGGAGARDGPSATERIFRTSGMIVRPEFYLATMPISREQERARLGLRPDLPTGLVMFGGHRLAQDAHHRAARGRGRVEDAADLLCAGTTSVCASNSRR